MSEAEESPLMRAAKIADSWLRRHNADQLEIMRLQAEVERLEAQVRRLRPYAERSMRLEEIERAFGDE